MKKLFKFFTPDSPIHVVLHAKWQRSKGRRPTSSFRNERNPKKALALAWEALRDPRERTFERIPLRDKIEKALGWDIVTVAEVQSAISHLHWANACYK